MTAFFASQTLEASGASIARVKWTAVLSACLDSDFDRRFSQEASGRPLWQPVTVATDLRRAVPPRTVPVFKLLGSLTHDDAACSTADFEKGGKLGSRCSCARRQARRRSGHLSRNVGLPVGAMAAAWGLCCGSAHLSVITHIS